MQEAIIIAGVRTYRKKIRLIYYNVHRRRSRHNNNSREHYVDKNEP